MAIGAVGAGEPEVAVGDGASDSVADEVPAWKVDEAADRVGDGISDTVPFSMVKGGKEVVVDDS